MELESFLRQTFHLRYPLVFGAVLTLIGPLAAAPPLRKLLSNVLLLHNYKQVAFLTAICFSMATLLTLQFWIIKVNGPDRFDDWAEETETNGHKQQGEDRFSEAPIHRYWSWSWAGTACWLVAALSLPVSSIVYSRRTADRGRDFPGNVSTGGAIVGLLGGVAMFALFLWVATFISSKYLHVDARVERLSPLDNLIVVSPSEALYPVGDRLGKLLSSKHSPEIPNGFARTKDTPGGPAGYLAPGHMEAAVLTGILLVYYLALYFITDGAAVDVQRRWLPTSFFAVLLLMTVSAILSWAGFWLDLYRLPPLLFVPILLYLASCRDDHFFRIHFGEAQSGSTSPESSLQNAPMETEAKHKRLLQRQPDADSTGNRTLVVITAPGGGIHAAAWTAQVLTGLHARYPQSFADSIGMISAVSGGSVGAMHYLNAFERLSDAHRQHNLGNDAVFANLSRQVVENAASSSLESVGWGLAFTDLADLLLPGWNFFEDRGEVVERQWNDLLLGPLSRGEKRCRRKLRRDRPTLRSWTQHVEEGRMPAFAFNATEIESGRRVIFSPLILPQREELVARRLSPRQFVQLYPNDADIDITTCVRLSATFPYVFPSAVSRHIRGGTFNDRGRLGRVVDGGYVDNEGIITAVDWISQLLKEEVRTFDRVVLIRIRHQGAPNAEGDDRQTPTPTSGFVSAIASPAQAMLSVRTSSQTERGQIEAELLQQIRDVEARLFDQLSEAEQQNVIASHPKYQKLKRPSGPANVLPNEDPTRTLLTPVFIDYQPPVEHALHAPLSWKLSPREFATYKAAWQAATDAENPAEGIRLLDELFADA